MPSELKSEMLIFLELVWGLIDEITTKNKPNASKKMLKCVMGIVVLDAVVMWTLALVMN